MGRIGLFSLSAVAIVCMSVEASAQAWPTRPIRAIVPYSAGSAIDSVSRVVFDQLSTQLGQPIIVDNRSGAGGTIGAGFVAKSDADGYTLLINSSAHAISPSLYSNLSFDTVRDFTAVTPLGTSPNVLVVAPSRGIKTVAELVAAAKAKPGSFTFSSLGLGTSTHLSAERFRFSAGFQAMHIPFRGGPEAITEVMAGRVDFWFGAVGLVLPNIREGNLLALVVNSHKRAAALPDVLTTAEAGFMEAEGPIWFGMFLPAKTPREIVEKLHHETARALQVPTVTTKLAALGIEPMEMTSAKFGALVQSEIHANAALIKAAGIKTY